MNRFSTTSWLARLRHAVLGAPIPSSKAHQERLSPSVGLAVFSSDALSSVAYATEAILSVLILKSMLILGFQMWISLAIVGLIAIITISYRQTIKAYPGGGGSYIVASDNLGWKFGVVAGAALLIDYILTVAVSIAAGVGAVVSAFPQLHPYLVQLSVLAIGIVAWANLRGMKESGAVFAIPTYGFVLSMLVMIALGVARSWNAGPVEQVVVSAPGIIGKEAEFALIYILFRAFAAGCTALTGIEAVADGVQAFRTPEVKNAASTLARMSIILVVLFLGMGFLALHLPQVSLFPTKSPEYRTLASQVAAYAFGGTTHPGFYTVQAFTALILILAANTAFADFPRLSSFLARDGFLPRYMARQGDRLVFHNGIIVLAIAAAILVVVFHGELDQLLPLYAVGVFTAFSLSQLGMVAHWKKVRGDGWRRSWAINTLGATLCIIVLLVILVTKFFEGAWIVAILLPLVCVGLVGIRRRYTWVAKQLELDADTVTESRSERRHLSLILVPRVNRGILQALRYARQLKGDCVALHVTLNERTLPDLQRRWNAVAPDVELVVLPSPYRSLISPILEYVDELRTKEPNVTITVVVAEAVSVRWYHRILSENVAQQLKQGLAWRKNVVVANVRYFLS